MPFDKDIDQETQDLDIEAATAEISDDLFGQGGDDEGDQGSEGEDEGQSSDGGENVDAAEQSSSPTDEGEKKAEGEEGKVVEGEVVENSEEVQAIGAPKTWTKEELATWATLPKETQEALAPILARREEDFLNGITQYKGAADLGVRYSQVVEPFAPMLAAENIDPVQLFQSFASNHYLLSRGTPQQKIDIAAKLINGYGIPLADLLNHIAEDDSSAPVDPKIAAMEREIQELRGVVTSRTTQEQQIVADRISAEIDTFAKDPANPYFDELANDIQQLFAAGAASTLKEAYEKAVWANPVTRQKELDRMAKEKQSSEQAEEQKRKDKLAKSTADSVDVSSRSRRSDTAPKGTMDDTLSETAAAIAARG